jgi:uncharacterized protein
VIGGVLRARAGVLIAFVAVQLLSILGASSLAIDPNNRVFFSIDHPHFRNLLDLEAAFGSNTNLVFVIESSQPLARDAVLPDAIRWLTAELWSVERVVSVDSIANMPVVEDAEDELLVEDLLDYVCPRSGSGRCETDRDWRFDRPTVLNRLVDQDRRVFSVVANVDLFDASDSIVPEIAAQAVELKRLFSERFPEYELYLTGAVPMMQAFMDAAERDVSSLLLLAIVVLTAGLYVFLGSVAATAVLVMVGVSAVVFALGFAGLVGLSLNTATATVPLVVFTLVVASAMHVFLHLVREPRLNDQERVQSAIKTSVLANWVPVSLTVATTVVGLLSLTFVSSPPMKQLGILSAVGVLFGGVATLIVAPCILSYLPRLVVSKSLVAAQNLMNKYAKWLERRRPAQYLLIVPFFIALGGLWQLSIDEDFVRYFSPDTMFRSDTQAITRLMSGPYHIDLVYDSGEQAGIFQQSRLAGLKALAALIREEPEVVSVVSISDVLEDAKFAFTGSRDLAASTEEELAQFFLTYELSLNVGHSSHNLLDSDQRRARVSVLLGDVSMGGIRELEARIRQRAQDAQLIDSITITGEGIPTAHLSSESIWEMSLGIAISVIFSAVIVGLCFRNLLAACTILLATGVPLFSAFGVWGWLDSEIGMAAVLVVATTIGVVIDDTIHLMYRYFDGRRSHELTGWGAAAYSVHKAGTAILINSAVLAAGLLVLSTSEFRMNSAFGFCSSLVIVLALAYSLTIAPKLLAGIRVD